MLQTVTHWRWPSNHLQLFMYGVGGMVVVITLTLVFLQLSPSSSTSAASTPVPNASEPSSAPAPAAVKDGTLRARSKAPGGLAKEATGLKALGSGFKPQVQERGRLEPFAQVQMMGPLLLPFSY